MPLLEILYSLASWESVSAESGDVVLQSDCEKKEEKEEVLRTW
jgi:hypothetical protein